MIKEQRNLTYTRLRQVLLYNSTNGWFTWKISPAFQIKAGTRAGSLSDYGYRRISIDGNPYYEHVLAYFYIMGRWPTTTINHKNHKKYDNRWENLELATSAEQAQKRGVGKKSISGITGIIWNEKRRKWTVGVTKNGVRKFVGHFSDLEDAKRARSEIEKTFNPPEKEFILKERKLPSITYLKNLVHYDTNSGWFTRLKITNPKQKIGERLGCEWDNGYRHIHLGNFGTFKEHILAYFYMTGKWPIYQIHHKDHDNSNNKWKNLEHLSPKEHSQPSNRPKYKANKSGYPGVFWYGPYKSARRKNGIWVVTIGVNGKNIRIGQFPEDKLNDAIAARKAAEEKYFTFRQKKTTLKEFRIIHKNF